MFKRGGTKAFWLPDISNHVIKSIVGGSEKSEGIRKHKNIGTQEHKIQRAIRERWGDKECPKDCSCLKSCEPLYTCPRAPFYRETNGLFTFRKYPQTKSSSIEEYEWTCFMNFDTPTLRGWRDFTEFPNNSPSGKRVDSDDPFPRKPLNLGKKCHPRNVGVDTRPPEISQRSNRGGFLKLPPAPIYSEPGP
jgi:hypothetical protein